MNLDVCVKLDQSYYQLVIRTIWSRSSKQLQITHDFGDPIAVFKSLDVCESSSLSD